MENTEQAKEYTEKQVDDAYDKGIENGKQHDPKVDEYGKELSEPIQNFIDVAKANDIVGMAICSYCGDRTSTAQHEIGRCGCSNKAQQYQQAPTRSEFIKSLLEKQESDKEEIDRLEFCLKTEKARFVRTKGFMAEDQLELTQAKKDIDELREGNNKLYRQLEVESKYIKSHGLSTSDDTDNLLAELY